MNTGFKLYISHICIGTVPT